MDTGTTELIKWNPFTVGYFDNPYHHLTDCRENNPIQKNVSVSNYIAFFRYKHVKEILKNTENKTSKLSAFFSQKEPIIFKNTSGCPFLSKSTSKWLMYIDDEGHSSARDFCQRGLDNMNYDRVVEDAANEILAILQNDKNSRIDLVDIAAQFPILIMNRILGIPPIYPAERFKDASHALAYSQDLFLSKQKYLDINKDMEFMFELLSELYDARVQKPDDTLISIFIALNNEGKWKFTKDEIISMLMILFMGGIETSKDTISVIFLETLKNRQLIQLLKTNSTIQNNLLIEELLRYSAPLQFTVRENQQAFELDGIFIPENTKLLLSIASANRDNTVFDNPNEIMPERKYNPHLSFGTGAHSCLGGKLARIELRTFLPKIAPLIDHYHLDTNHPPVWQKTILMRGVKHLPAVKA